jgi:hypothetical protein
VILVGTFETREFERPRWQIVCLTGEAAFIVLVALLIWDGHNSVDGPFLCAFGVIMLGISGWFARTPFAVTSDEEMKLFLGPLRRRTVRWDEIRETDVKGRFMGGTMILVLSNGRKVQIPLGYLDRQTRQSFVQQVRNAVEATPEAGIGKQQRQDRDS